MPGHSNYKKYRLLPLIGVGVLILVALVLIALLIWSLAAFGGQRDPAQSGATAAVIYLCAVFIACLAMILLIRGGTVIPPPCWALWPPSAPFCWLPDQRLSARSC